VTYSEADIAKAASSESGLFGDNGEGLNEAEQDILNYVQREASKGVKVSTTYLVERFGAKPYGWPTNAILCLAASLSGKGKLEARSDGAVLEGADLARNLNNNRALANILLTPQVEFSAVQIRKAKELYKDLFDLPSGGTDARTIGAEWAGSIRILTDDLSRLVAQKVQYPFLAALEPLGAKVAGMGGKSAAWYMTEPAKQEDDLLNAKEDILDKIRSFMGGDQKKIYDDAREFLRAQEANISYVDAASGAKLAAALDDPNCFKGAVIQAIKSDLYALKDRVELTVLDERKAVIVAVDDCAGKVAQTPEFQALAPEEKERIRRRIDSHKAGLDGVKMIPMLRDRANGAKLDLLPRILAEVEQLSPPTPPEPAPNTSKPTSGFGERSAPPKPVPGPSGPSAPPPAPTYINASKITVAFAKPFLTDEADVEQYVQEMKRTLLVEIRAGKKVIV
jgi:hypothetical protein